MRAVYLEVRPRRSRSSKYGSSTVVALLSWSLGGVRQSLRDKSLSLGEQRSTSSNAATSRNGAIGELLIIVMLLRSRRQLQSRKTLFNLRIRRLRTMCSVWEPGTTNTSPGRPWCESERVRRLLRRSRAYICSSSARCVATEPTVNEDMRSILDARGYRTRAKKDSFASSWTWTSPFVAEVLTERDPVESKPSSPVQQVWWSILLESQPQHSCFISEKDE